jgi:hypothetical protein
MYRQIYCCHSKLTDFMVSNQTDRLTWVSKSTYRCTGVKANQQIYWCQSQLTDFGVNANWQILVSKPTDRFWYQSQLTDFGVKANWQILVSKPTERFWCQSQLTDYGIKVDWQIHWCQYLLTNLHCNCQG